MRYLLALILIICFGSCFSQTAPETKDSTTEYLSQMQMFIQHNESLRVPDSVKRQNLYRQLKSFIIEHPKAEINFTFIYWGINLNYKQIHELTNLVDSSIHNVGSKAWADMALKRISVAETGKPFPTLILTDTLGNQLSVFDLKGKIVLIDVWSSWCVPCREEIPDIKKLYKKYNSKGLEIIGISMDEHKQNWLKAIREDKQTWKAYCELKNWRANKFAKQFSIYKIPANFLIDQNGILVGQDMSVEAVNSWIAEHK
ncbi:MAG: TlpA disulfide reductase family protein [Ferruginibacter sp.]